MLPLSVVILTRNEEKNIERCLAPVRQISDDILVMDTGSTDQTIALAKKAGARVMECAWLGYAETKNKTNAQTRYDWVLSLDADEVVNTELLLEIDHLFKNGTPPGNCAFALKRLMVYDGTLLKHGALANEYRIRLFNKHHARWNNNTVHEQIEFSNPVQIKKLKGFLWHYSYEDQVEHQMRIKHYASLFASQRLANKKYSSPLKKYFSAGFGFVKNYFFKLGFLDGLRGWQYAKTEMDYTYRKYQLSEKPPTDS